MMVETIFGTIAALVLAALALAILVPGKRKPDKPVQIGTANSYETVERAAMPREIADGRLVISEQTYYRRGARPFAAKTDQGFLTSSGLVVMVESKSRRRISPSDIVQVSCQALAASSDPKCPWRVANYGYIRLAPVGRRPYYQRVDLVHPTRIDLLWDRWKALRDGRIAPIARPKPHRCNNCVLRTRCPSAKLS